MKSALLWFVPPLVGALIGYLTNYIAIRMLFRPLRPWHLFGIRVPLTPGVIPAKRRDLAENIGIMVGRHLLTGDDIRQGLGARHFKHQLHELVSGRFTILLHRELGSVASLIPPQYRDDVYSMVRVARRRLVRFLLTLLNSASVTATLQTQLRHVLDRTLARPLDQVMESGSRARLCAVVERMLHRILAGVGFRLWFQEMVRQRVADVLEQGASLQSILPDPATVFFHSLVDQQAPKLLRKAAEYLGEPAMRDRLVRAICSGIDQFVGSLGPLAALAANFLNPVTIEHKVREYLQSHEEEIRQWLLNDEVADRLTGLLHERLDQVLATPLPTLLQHVSASTRLDLCDRFSLQVVEMLARPDIAATITEALGSYLEARHDQPLQALLVDLLGQDGLAHGDGVLNNGLSRILQSDAARKMLNRLVADLLEERLLDRPLGRLSSLLPARLQTSVDQYLVGFINDLLVREVPVLVEAMDIQRLVALKVNSLDLLHLEGLLLSIMQDQFKYINLFGALLGFLIGCLNLFILGQG